MSIFFLNSTNRLYNDAELNAVSKILFSNGVFNSKEDSHASWKESGDFFIEAAGSGMNVIAKPGMASVLLNVTRNSETIQQRAIIKEDSQLSAEVASNPSIANRNDAVVLRIDQSVIDGDELNEDGTNAVSLVVVSGNSATELTDAEISVALSGDPFVRLANILVPQGTTEITEQMITDARTLVKMSRAIKLASDILKLFGVEDDPESPEQGDIWYNSFDGILKMYDGENIIALSQKTFDWGYYGDFNNSDEFDAIDENNSIESLTDQEIYTFYKPSQPLEVVFMRGQIFEMPPVANPLVRIKMGNPQYSTGITIRTYTVDGAYKPVALVETLKTFAEAEIPKNDYLEVSLDSTLYTVGVNYMIIINGQLDIFEGSIVNGKRAMVKTSYNNETIYLKGTSYALNGSSITTNPLSLTWQDRSQYTNFVMAIYEKDEIAIGKLDTTGQINKVIQPFTSRSKDIVGFYVTKGINIGTPTGDINIKLYNADINGKPTGSILAQGAVTNTTWESYEAGEKVLLPISHDSLIVGSRYAIVIDCDNESDTDNYTIYFGIYEKGTALRYNTADSYVALNGDLYYGIKVSQVKKIVTTGNDGLIPAELTKRKIQYLDYLAAPEYDISQNGMIIMPLATGNIDLTTNAKGTPFDGQEIEFRIKASGGARTVTYGSLFESRWASMVTSITDTYTLRSVFQYDKVRGKFGCVFSAIVA